ncbi:glycoside hydrolase family 26 protein [Pseudonocardia sp. GCM10023141]|uniref:glycoside hydrolase family 26 protein n=1 Tax=Pseudonocardia sp. GCM10023141 TaxID=3252653 RepID=UPI00360DC445
MKPTVPRALAAVFLLLLGLYVFRWGPELGAADAPESTWTYVPPAPVPSGQRAAAALPTFPPAGRTFLGVQTRAGVDDFTDERTFAAATGVRPSVYQFSLGWAVDDFDPRTFAKAAARGMLPLMSWEPWDFRDESRLDRERSNQPDYRLARIIDGSFDAYITSWAQGIATLRYPVAVRLGHEMNGYWYPWSEQSNGNRPGEYVQMWRHVHDIFTAAGASNVIWVWSPNVTYDTATPLPGLYPGDSYVDWIGLSGYFGVDGQLAYRSFNVIFGPTLAEVAKLSSRPVVITEVGATDATGRRAEWITGMFRSIPRYPQIIGLIWYEAVREVDWRIGGSPTSAGAFREGAADPRYDAPWSPATRPLTSAG